VQAFAELPRKAAADDFVVFWDNAYAVHDFHFPKAPLTNVYPLAIKAGTQDHFALFSSTSKITLASAGLAFCAGSDRFLNAFQKTLGVMLIGPDKVTQLKHARFLASGIDKHMARHAEILRPKFELVERILERDLRGLGIATWTKPQGGYFVSLDALPGTAKRIVALAADSGLTLTAAGAPFPYGRDPEDRNLRIGPTFATEDELALAMPVLTTCVKLACLQQLREDA